MNQDQISTINKMFVKLIERLYSSQNIEESIIYDYNFYNYWMSLGKEHNLDNILRGGVKFYLDKKFEILPTRGTDEGFVIKDIYDSVRDSFPEDSEYCVIYYNGFFFDSYECFIRLYQIEEDPKAKSKVFRVKLELKNSDIKNEIEEKIYGLKLKLREIDKEKKKNEESDKVRFAEDILNKLEG